MPVVKGCSRWGGASLLGAQKTQKQGTIMGCLTSRQQSRSHAHVWPYTVREDKQLQNLNHAQIIKKKKKSDADPNFPDCTGTLGSPGHLMVWTNPAVLGMMTAACAHHGCPWYNQLPLLWASTFPTASERAGAEQKMAQLIFSWKINRVALLLRNVSGKTVTLFNTISSSLTDWKVVKAAI